MLTGDRQVTLSLGVKAQKQRAAGTLLKAAKVDRCSKVCI
jgi:hypothetical protein